VAGSIGRPYLALTFGPPRGMSRFEKLTSQRLEIRDADERMRETLKL